MKTPNKIRNFTWKACKNILATKTNLKRCNITNDNLCISYKKQFETNGHMFLFCDKAKEVWSSSKLVFPFLVDRYWDFSDLIWHIIKLSLKKSGTLEKIVTICWEIWKNRNVVHHGGVSKMGCHILKKALSMVKEYKAAHEEVITHKVKEEIGWNPLSTTRYRVNVDEATFTDSKTSGMGLVIRNEWGQVMVAMSRRIPAHYRPLVWKQKPWK